VSAARETWAGDLSVTVSITADVVVTAPATFRSLGDIEYPEQSLVGIACSRRAPRCGMARSAPGSRAPTRVVLELFNIFDAKVSDIDYFYTSRLPAESPTASTTFTRIQLCRDRYASPCACRSEVTSRKRHGRQ
jgi:hypothetical protein